MNEKIESYWRIYQEINEWVKYSDAKAGILVTIYGVLYTIIFTNPYTLNTYFSSSIEIILLSILFGIFSIISMFYAFRCLNPRLKSEKSKSVIFFGYIAQIKHYKDYMEYSEKVFNDNRNTIEHLTEQIHVNSQIAWKKFSNITVSIRFFFASIATLILIIFFNSI